MSTISAISTASGVGGIGIVRMSGEDCFPILEKIFKPKNPQKIEEIPGYHMKYGTIVNPKNEEIIDEVLVSYFKAPHSYTTENMCEINSHGGAIVMRKILELTLENGAELAEPGEFTKRAFINGRIDLSQAESVIDIIQAKSEREVKASVKQLEGYLSEQIHGIKQEILDVLVDVEASIDYPEYDVEEVTNEKALNMLENIKEKLKKLSESFKNGKLVKDGIKTVIIGKPNAGKSSLLNAILREDRAIVTNIEGTTRDTIEEFITVEGIPLKLIDTAGIREAKDEVEQIGIDKAKELANEADLVIAILDASRTLSKEDRDILNIASKKTSLIILNKTDLVQKIDEKTEEIAETNKRVVKISALNKTGIEEIFKEISDLFQFNQINFDNENMITNIRHKNLIDHAINNVEQSIDTLKNKMPIDIIAIYIKNILEDLSNITGENVSEDIIQEIFSKFCLGK
ncbi:MAG: tRNA uridine-5-carboxymethylaminomethyl(34) synthesis GTPase MnmE [Clostridia bacterium]